MILNSELIERLQELPSTARVFIYVPSVEDNFNVEDISYDQGEIFIETDIPPTVQEKEWNRD